MTPYALTLLTDELGLVAFSILAATGGAFLLAERRVVQAVVLLSASALVAAGLVPVFGRLLAGGMLDDGLFGLTLAESVPWAALALLVWITPTPGPRHHRVDGWSLGGLVLGAQGIAGFGLGLGLIAQRWLAPDPLRSRTPLLLALGALAVALAIDDRLFVVRDALGRGLGLSADASVWVTHLVVSVLEAAGWSVIGARVGGAAASRGAARRQPRP